MTTPPNLKYIYDADITVSKATFLVLPCSLDGEVTANVKQPVSGVYEHAVFSGANKAGTIKVCGSKKSKQRIVVGMFVTTQASFRKALKELTDHIASEAKPAVCFPLMREDWQQKMVEAWATANSNAVIRVVSSSPEQSPEDVEEVDVSEEEEIKVEPTPKATKATKKEPKATPKAVPVAAEEDEELAVEEPKAKAPPKKAKATPVVAEEDEVVVEEPKVAQKATVVVDKSVIESMSAKLLSIENACFELRVQLSWTTSALQQSSQQSSQPETAAEVTAEDEEDVVGDVSDEVETPVEDEDVAASSDESQTLLDFTRENIPAGWEDFFEVQLEGGSIEEVSDALQAEVTAGHTFFPPMENVYEALSLVAPSEIKVVIIGQDPYHDDGQAMGLAFSVPDGVKIPSSLQNIFKELKSDGFTPGSNGDLSLWAVGGVLLINTALTVRAHKPNSHSKMWSIFTEQLFRYINDTCEHIVVVMWGAEAQKYASLFDSKKHKMIKSPHPSGLSCHKGFFGSKPFSTANEMLEKMGVDIVDWSLE